LIRDPAVDWSTNAAGEKPPPYTRFDEACSAFETA
jgi:hypothetical protein